MNVAGIVLKYYFDHGYVYGLVPLFDFDAEKNIPTIYSSIALLFVSVFLMIISLLHKKLKSPYFLWLGLAVIFLFLSTDESASIHERFITPLRDFFSVSGVLYFAWVIPYGIALAIFIVVYFRFLMGLPKGIRNLFLISGTVFVTGAIGFEMIGGRLFELYGKENLMHAVIYTCEEFLEMLGVSIFIYTLFVYMAIEFQSFTISFSEQKKRTEDVFWKGELRG